MEVPVATNEYTYLTHPLFGSEESSFEGIKPQLITKLPFGSPIAPPTLSFIFGSE